MEDMERNHSHGSCLAIIAYNTGVVGRFIPSHQIFDACCLYLGFIDEKLRSDVSPETHAQ